jgi:N6-L-threonylcarbamoyladenine synthase
MLILGIESSCDETAAAVVESGRAVRSNVIASQDALHKEYGGVVPEIASRAHLERLVPTVERALREAGCAAGDLSAVAVGHRPGLIGSLLVGVAAAKALAWSLNLPLIGIDHVQAHLYAGALDAELPAFPALGLVVSGGHTHLYRCLSPIEIACIGSTIDDAVGEAYDKVGAMLGLPYPGGPRVDALAHTLPASEPLAHDFPVSRLEPTSLDFSFSGLKTAVLYVIRGVPEQTPGGPRFPRELADLTDDERAQIAASFQRAACRAITIKVQRAARAAEVPYRSLLVGGGVSANKRLRAELTNLAADEDLDIRLPHIRYCLDNAAMIAGLAHHRLAAGQTDDLSLRAAPSSALSPA